VAEHAALAQDEEQAPRERPHRTSASDEQEHSGPAPAATASSWMDRSSAPARERESSSQAKAGPFERLLALGSGSPSGATEQRAGTTDTAP
jgi:hypothetical protein